jgi:hypothetical protein
MKLPFCSHEVEIARLLDENRLPENSTLLAHAEKCARCSEVVFAIQILQRGRASSLISAHAGSPGYLWWRAQLRRQNGVVEKVTKPIVWAERFALISMLCIATGFGFWQSGQLHDWFSRLAVLLGYQALPLNSIWLRATNTSSLMAVSMLAGLFVVACIGGLALYILAADEN